LLSHLKWPLSQGFDLNRYRIKPLVSYQIYRQLSVWDFHPLVICALGAHYTFQDIPQGPEFGPLFSITFQDIPSFSLSFFFAMIVDAWSF